MTIKTLISNSMTFNECMFPGPSKSLATKVSGLYNFLRVEESAIEPMQNQVWTLSDLMGDNLDQVGMSENAPNPLPAPTVSVPTAPVMPW